MTLEEYKKQKENMAIGVFKMLATGGISIQEVIGAVAASYIIFKDQDATHVITTSDGFNIYED